MVSATFEGVGVDRALDPVAWQQAWSRYLEEGSVMPSSVPSISQGAGRLLSQSSLASLEEHRKDLCLLQYDLAELVRSKRQADYFDEKWTSMSRETREAHIIQGLLASCNATVDMEERRRYCFETTSTNLERGNGRGFLDLLSTYCPRDAPEPTLQSEPTLLSHPVHDAIYFIGKRMGPKDNKEAIRVFQRMSCFARNFFLTFFLWNTLLNVYGISQEYGANKPVDRGSLGSKTKKELRNVGLSDDVIKSAEKESKEASKRAVRHCTNCQKPEHRLPSGQVFSQCVKCKAIGRKVLYCDRNCQINDWKNGNPPHKQVCGKAFEPPADVVTRTKAERSATDDDDAFPPPDPGFTRSPALVHQLALLKRNPQISYVFVEPDPKPDQGVTFSHFEGNLFFRIIFNRAIKNGDPHAVGRMAEMLADVSTKLSLSFPKHRILLQLSEEFGLSIDTISEMSQPGRTMSTDGV